MVISFACPRLDGAWEAVPWGKNKELWAPPISFLETEVKMVVDAGSLRCRIAIWTNKEKDVMLRALLPVAFFPTEPTIASGIPSTLSPALPLIALIGHPVNISPFYLAFPWRLGWAQGWSGRGGGWCSLQCCSSSYDFCSGEFVRHTTKCSGRIVFWLRLDLQIGKSVQQGCVLDVAVLDLPQLLCYLKTSLLWSISLRHSQPPCLCTTYHRLTW